MLGRRTRSVTWIATLMMVTTMLAVPWTALAQDATPEVSGETVLLFRRDSGRLVVIDGVDSAQLIRMTVPIGTEAPMLRGGGLDAFLTDDERRSLPASQHPMAGDALQSTLRNGYFVLDSMYPHASAVGAPVWSGPGRARIVGGAVIVVGPRERIGAASYQRLGPLVRDAAAAISATV